MSDIPPISNSHNFGQHLPPKVKKRKDKYSLPESIQKTSDLEYMELNVAKLLGSPDTRPEMVALGKQLAKSPNFPSVMCHV